MVVHTKILTKEDTKMVYTKKKRTRLDGYARCLQNISGKAHIMICFGQIKWDMSDYVLKFRLSMWTQARG